MTIKVIDYLGDSPLSNAEEPIIIASDNEVLKGSKPLDSSNDDRLLQTFVGFGDLLFRVA
jgi:hypothetical protein